MTKPYIIGTRGSLLALTQCTQIKNELEEKTGKNFELKIIKTQGDMVTDKALWQLEGKDFFTKELDAALLNKEIDLVVHSYKDLGSERPEGISLAAITKRDYGHDILLTKKQTVSKLKEKKSFLVGTSSPRRIANTKNHLKDFLPFGKNLEIETKVLRGNVNTRIEKLIAGKYDAIILALPGLERLANSKDSKEILARLLKDLTFMIMPQSHFPSAASQGALAIECLEDRKELIELLKSVEDQQTVLEMQAERKVFQSYGGGCHLAVGIQVQQTPVGLLHIHRGEVDNKKVHLQFLDKQRTPKKEKRVFVGLPNRENTDQFLYDHMMEKKEIQTILPKGQFHVMVASRYGLNYAKELADQSQIIWSAGSSSWKNLASQGIWVHGSSDSLGEEEVLNLSQSKALSLIYGKREWICLTNNKSYSNLGPIVPVYEKALSKPSDDFKEEIKQIETFYWTSFDQYESYIKEFPEIEKKTHCCGLGKTLFRFNQKDIGVQPFSSMEEFYKWIF